jgi:hypothetical protein
VPQTPSPVLDMRGKRLVKGGVLGHRYYVRLQGRWKEPQARRYAPALLRAIRGLGHRARVRARDASPVTAVARWARVCGGVARARASAAHPGRSCGADPPVAGLPRPAGHLHAAAPLLALSLHGRLEGVGAMDLYLADPDGATAIDVVERRLQRDQRREDADSDHRATGPVHDPAAGVWTFLAIPVTGAGVLGRLTRDSRDGDGRCGGRGSR